MEGRNALVVRRVGVGSRFKKQPKRLDATRPGREMQWCPLPPIWLVHLRSIFDQEPDDSDVWLPHDRHQDVVQQVPSVGIVNAISVMPRVDCGLDG